MSSYYLDASIDFSISLKLKKRLLEERPTRIAMRHIIHPENYKRKFLLKGKSVKESDTMDGDSISILEILLDEQETKSLHSNHLILNIKMPLPYEMFDMLSNKAERDYQSKVEYLLGAWFGTETNNADIRINEIYISDGVHPETGEKLFYIFSEMLEIPDPQTNYNGAESYANYLSYGSGLLLRPDGTLKFEYQFWTEDGDGDRFQSFIKVDAELQESLNDIVRRYDALEYHLDSYYGLFEEAILENPTVEAPKILSYLYSRFTEIDKRDGWESPKLKDL